MVDAVVVDGVHAAVGRREQPRLGERTRGAARGREIRRLVVLLVRPHHDVRRSVVIDVADRRRVDDLAATEGTHAGTGRQLVVHRIHDHHLRLIDDQHREAREESAGGAPRVDVAIAARDDDVELAVAVEVGERRRADGRRVDRVVAVAGVVAREGGVHRDGEGGLPPPAVIEDVDLALEVGGHHVEEPVAVEVADGDRGEDGAVPRRRDRARGVGRRASVER